MELNIGDKLKGKRSKQVFEVTDLETALFGTHDIYTLKNVQTGETRKIAKFAVHRKYTVYDGFEAASM